MLLTDELAPRWHWGVNLSFETEISGPRSREYEITAGVSYTLIDEKLSVGIETEDSAGKQVVVVRLFHLHGIQDHLLDLG